MVLVAMVIWKSIDTAHQFLYSDNYMAAFLEARKVKYSTTELDCRYLNINLPLSASSTTNSGRFGAELKNIGIVSYPFGITAAELVSSGILKPALYVELPQSYFELWQNFPELPEISSDNFDNEVGMYHLEIVPQTFKELSDVIHPYDGGLKQSFVENHHAEVPSDFVKHIHNNGRNFIAAEAYLPYWHTYLLADSFYLYRHTASLFSSKEARNKILENLRKKAVRFCERYEKAFERLSWYKTVVSGWHFSTINFTHGEIFSLVQRFSGVNVELLERDLKCLLELDAEWANQISKDGCVVLQKARNNLTKDIYLIYEQLRLFDRPAKSIFENPEYNVGSPSLTPLHELLNVEYYSFKQSFVSYGNFYCAEIKCWGYDCSEDIYDKLYQVKGFDAWIRSFHDLHQSLNNTDTQSATFKQNRIVDMLIVMSVRTEVVLREMFRPKLQGQSDEPIVDFLKKLKPELDCFEKTVLETCCSEIKTRTKLNNRPDQLFKEIDNLAPRNWSKQKLFFLRAILKFITARNYFAHHAYKDADLNIQTSQLAAEILNSLLATLLFFEKSRL
ncbi:hypothetical protein [Methylophilus sp. 3sh_L]|uniref:hypothetical protein n=1 Tax=Methylophilus sp. 3sh_L TaxID=3377114 RepID=UPI00398EDDFB